MKTVSFYNEKGNVATKMRDAIRKATYEKTLDVLSNGFDGVVENANGGISIPVATDVGGNTIYATLTMVITDANPMVKKEKKAKAKAEPAPIELGSLFD